MPNKNEAGSPQQERLRDVESAAETGGGSPSLRTYKEERDELVSLTDAAKEQLGKRDEVLGGPSAQFSRAVVDRYNSELQEIAGKVKGLLDRMHEYRFMPPSKRWTDKQQAELEKTIEKSTSILDKIDIPISLERQISIKRSIDTKLHSEMLESMEETKEKRVELTRRIKRAKASFAGKYKISYDRAIILSQAPIGWLGRLADRLAGNTPLTSKELVLAKRLKTQEAQDDMQGLAKVLEEADGLWAEIHHAEKGSITTPDALASTETLRAVVKESYPDASEEEREQKAEAAVEEIQELGEYEDKVATAEMAGEALEEKERETMIPPPPETVEELLAKKKAEEQKMLSETVGRLKNTETPEQAVINECIEAFGGGTKGKEAAAEMWDEIQNKISMGVNKVDFTALDYVQTAANLRVAAGLRDSESYKNISLRLEKMNKALGYPEFMNPATGAGMKSPDLTKSKALGRNIARSEMGKRAERITAMETRTDEAAGRARPEGKESMGQPLSIEWASALLTPEVAGREWEDAVKLMQGNRDGKREKDQQVELASFMISDTLSTLQNKLWGMKNLSDTYSALAKYNGKPKGNPPEATSLVMLKAFDRIMPITEDDKAAQKEIHLALGEIYRALALFNKPSETPTLRPPAGKTYEDEEKLTSAISTATQEALKEAAELPRFNLEDEETSELPRFNLEGLDESPEPPTLRRAKKNETTLNVETPKVKRVIDKLAGEGINLMPKSKQIPQEALRNYKTAIKKFFAAKNDAEINSTFAVIRGLDSKYRLNNEAKKRFEDSIFNAKTSLVIGVL